MFTIITNVKIVIMNQNKLLEFTGALAISPTEIKLADGTILSDTDYQKLITRLKQSTEVDSKRIKNYPGIEVKKIHLNDIKKLLG